MLETKKRFWIRAGETLPPMKKNSDPWHDINFNIVCSTFNYFDVSKSIEEIRKHRCGFDFRMPTINLYMNVNDFSSSIAEKINCIDNSLPHITVNLVIADDEIKKDTLISMLHKKHDVALKNKIHIDFDFVLFKDYRILGMVLHKIDQLKAVCGSHNDNLSSQFQIVLEISPMIFFNENINFFENTHFEIDNLISEMSSSSYFNMDINISTCGLINILRHIALCRGIAEKFFTLSTKEFIFSFSEKSCFFNLFDGQSLSCIDCKNKLLKNLPLNLGIFNTAAQKFLRNTGEKDEFKVLVSDWDYIA